jgi:hypothetical protein
VISLIFNIFIAILRTLHFPLLWNTPVESPTLNWGRTRHCRHPKVQQAVWFRPNYGTSLQLAHVNDRLTKNFGEKGLKGVVFFHRAKAFDTVGIDGLL